MGASCRAQVDGASVAAEFILLHRQPRTCLIQRILRIAQELRRRDHASRVLVPQRPTVVVQRRIRHSQSAGSNLDRRIAAVANDRMSEAAGAGSAANGDGSPVAGRGRKGAAVVVGVAAMGVVLERGQDDGRGLGAVEPSAGR